MTYLYDKCTLFSGDDVLYPLNPDNIVILFITSVSFSSSRTIRIDYTYLGKYYIILLYHRRSSEVCRRSRACLRMLSLSYVLYIYYYDSNLRGCSLRSRGGCMRVLNFPSRRVKMSKNCRRRA